MVSCKPRQPSPTSSVAASHSTPEGRASCGPGVSTNSPAAVSVACGWSLCRAPSTARSPALCCTQPSWELAVPTSCLRGFHVLHFLLKWTEKLHEAGSLLGVLCPVLFLHLTWAGAHLWNVLLTEQDPAPPEAQLNAIACCSLPGSTFAAASQWPLASCGPLACPCFREPCSVSITEPGTPSSPALASLKAETISFTPLTTMCSQHAQWARRKEGRWH